MSQVSLSEDVYRKIRENIFNGTFSVGMRINEVSLSKDLHVSRTPVRIALKRIFDEGLLDYSRNQGYRVRVLSAEDIDEIFKIRLALELLAFREAANRMTPQDYDHLNEIMEDTARAIASKDLPQIIETSARFNDAIYTYAQLPRLSFMVERLKEYLLAFRNVSYKDEESSRRERAFFEHKAIIKSMKEKDFDTLALQIEDHLLLARDYLMSQVNEFEKTHADLFEPYE